MDFLGSSSPTSGAVDGENGIVSGGLDGESGVKGGVDGESGVVKANKGMILRKSVDYIRYSFLIYILKMRFKLKPFLL